MCLQGSCKAGPTVYFKNRRFKVDGSSISFFFGYESCLFFPKDRYSAQYVVWRSCRKREGKIFLHSSKELEIAQTTHWAMSAFNQFVSTLKLLVRGPCGNLAVPSFSLSQFFHFLLFIITFLFKSVFLNLTNHKNHLNAC